MLIAVYKTPKKAGMYLYIPRKDDFSEVPEPLMAQFGSPQLVMLLPPHKHTVIAGVDAQKLVSDIASQGFYLQVPPKEQDLLVEHRLNQGLTAQPIRR
jgi:uncharacterized protein YcgL (UPF0745 family)